MSELDTGPELTKVPKYRKKKHKQELSNDSLRKRAKFFFIGNMASTGGWLLVYIFIILILFSLFVFGKAFLCPDFASMKRNPSWYCHIDDADAAK